MVLVFYTAMVCVFFVFEHLEDFLLTHELSNCAGWKKIKAFSMTWPNLLIVPGISAAKMYPWARADAGSEWCRHAAVPGS